jgi:nitrite reductase/ring-hydroxylating ferredoxin subunit
MGPDLKCPGHFALFDVPTGKVSARTGWAPDMEMDKWIKQHEANLQFQNKGNIG